MENTTKAGIGSILSGIGALVIFIVNWVTTKQVPSAEAFEVIGATIGVAVSAGIGLIKAADNK